MKRQVGKKRDHLPQISRGAVNRRVKKQIDSDWERAHAVNKKTITSAEAGRDEDGGKSRHVETNREETTRHETVVRGQAWPVYLVQL